MFPPLFLLEAGTIRFQEGYSEKGRKGNHLYFSRNVKIAAKTLDRGGGMHYPIKHTKMIGMEAQGMSRDTIQQRLCRWRNSRMCMGG